jgi:hypothetical protein
MSGRLLKLSAAAVLASTMLIPAGAEVVFRGTPDTFETIGKLPAPTVVVPPAALSLDAVGTTTLAYGQDWNAIFTASGGKPNYSFSIAPTNLPSGIGMVENGSTASLTGRTKNGTYGPFTVTVKDGENTSKSALLGPFEVAPPAQAFSIAAATPARISKGTAWTVTFAGAGGLAPYTLTGATASGDGTVGRYTVPGATGFDHAGASAAAASVQVIVGSDPLLAADAYSLTGVDAVSSAAVPKTVRITNTGDLPTSSAPVVTVASGPLAIQDNLCTGILGGGLSCTFDIRTNKTTDGPYTGSVTVAGVATPIAVSGTVSGYSPSVSLSPTTATASIVSAGSPGPATTFTVTNSTIAATGVVATLTNTTDSTTSPYFSVTGGTCAVGTPLAAGAQCTVLVSRVATANDVDRSATLKVTPNGGSSVTATVSGTATSVLATCTASMAFSQACSIDGIPSMRGPVAGDKYVALCDLGMTWNGTTCTGTGTLYTWGPAVAFTGTPALSSTNGQANTGLRNSTYPAANACALIAGGKWYLPTASELSGVYPGGSYSNFYKLIGNWTSTENVDNKTQVWGYQKSATGSNDSTPAYSKSSSNLVRCMRKTT